MKHARIIILLVVIGLSSCKKDCHQYRIRQELTYKHFNVDNHDDGLAPQGTTTEYMKECCSPPQMNVWHTVSTVKTKVDNGFLQVTVREEYVIN